MNDNARSMTEAFDALFLELANQGDADHYPTIDQFCIRLDALGYRLNPEPQR